VLVKAIFECLAAVNKDHRHFISELAPELIVSIHVHFAPVESSAAMQFGECFLHDLAQVTAFARVNDHLPGFRHAQSLAISLGNFHQDVVAAIPAMATRFC